MTAASPDWITEFRQALRTNSELQAFLGWPASASCGSVEATYPIFVPRRIAQKIKNQGPDGALARQFLPHPDELNVDLNASGLADPIGDEAHLRAPQLIHRYPSRALFAPTTVCPIHCRYCFRKNELSTGELFRGEFEKTLEYLATHPEITEIIFTGGDPFTLSDERLQFYLKAFQKIPSIRDVRFHTRYPTVLPARFTKELLSILDETCLNFRTVSIAVHVNHPSEIDLEVEDCLRSLQRLPVLLLSQSVLLAGVNDSVEDLCQLYGKFIELKVRPYYLHHPDRVKGGMHFYLGLQRGREIVQELRKHLPGWALPTYIFDVPGGHGKVPALNPEGTSFSGTIMSLNGDPVVLSEP